MFSLAIRWNVRSDNPAQGIERNTKSKRKRYLSGDELLRLTGALAAHADKSSADVIRILLLTGCRQAARPCLRVGPISTWLPASGPNPAAQPNRKLIM